MKVGNMKLLTLLIMFAGEATASTFFRVPDEKLIESAEHIVMGDVEKIDVTLENNTPFQYISIKVEKIYKTNPDDALQEGDSVVIKQIGGESQGRYIKVDGLPSFVVGTTVFLNLKKNEEGYFYVIGSNQGKFEVLNRREMVRDTTESMFVRKGENGKMLFFDGAVEKQSLEEMVTKVRLNTVE